MVTVAEIVTTSRWLGTCDRVVKEQAMKRVRFATCPRNPNELLDALVTRPLARHLGCCIRPNTITAVNMAVKLAACWAFWCGHLWPMIGLMLIERLLDNLDGEVARACNMGTPLGEKLDLYSDMIYTQLMALIAVVTARRAGNTTLTWVSLAVLAVVVSSHAHLVWTGGHLGKSYTRHRVYQQVEDWAIVLLVGGAAAHVMARGMRRGAAR